MRKQLAGIVHLILQNKRCFIYVPTTLPEPHHKAYIDHVVESALPVLRASRGRAFFLCTNLRAMQRVYELLLCTDEFPLLLQGKSSRSYMLERFRELSNAILIGSHSFWEGVDVRAEALSLINFHLLLPMIQLSQHVLRK